MEVTAPQGVSIPVHDQSQIGEARREAALLAARLGLNEEAIGRVSLVVTEAGRNIFLHGGGGELLLNVIEGSRRRCIELLAIDRGRGMEDVQKCMRDGYSTAGTPGTGLGAIARVADSFDLYSAPGRGTVLMSRFGSKCAGQSSIEPFEYSAASVASPGEPLSGDAWATTAFSGGQTFFVADGLGHGQYAEEAAGEAVRVFGSCNGAKPAEIIERVHGALRSTRGAAVAVARIDLQQQKVTFAGVGNISASINDGNDSSRSMVSMNGTVGHQMRKVQEFVYPWAGDPLLVMHSDGLGTRWDLKNYPGVKRRSPGVIAGVLYRDFSRRRDDVTVLVARCAQK